MRLREVEAMIERGKYSFVRWICLLLILLISAGFVGCTDSGSKKPEASSSPTFSITEEERSTLAAARADTQIGIWYSIWYDLKETGSLWDDDKGTTNQPIYYRPLLPDGTYGKYDSGDRSIMKYHIQEITDAGIDFIILDQTNDIDTGDGTLNMNARNMVRCIWQWNKEEGNRKLRYCSAIGALAEMNGDMSIIESEAKKLWERYVDTDWGTENDHVYVDGKPLMVVFPFTEEEWDAYTGSKEYANRFTIRFAEGHAYEPGYWGWAMPKGTLVNEDVACIIPGWYKFNHPLEKVYRNKGKTYKKNWETLLASELIPDFVVINSFNEYAEHTAVFAADTSGFPKGYPLEKWVNENGEETPSLYWDMTKEYIAKYRNGDII